MLCIQRAKSRLLATDIVWTLACHGHAINADPVQLMPHLPPNPGHRDMQHRDDMFALVECHIMTRTESVEC